MTEQARTQNQRDVEHWRTGAIKLHDKALAMVDNAANQERIANYIALGDLAARIATLYLVEARGEPIEKVIRLSVEDGEPQGRATGYLDLRSEQPRGVVDVRDIVSNPLERTSTVNQASRQEAVLLTGDYAFIILDKETNTQVHRQTVDRTLSGSAYARAREQGEYVARRWAQETHYTIVEERPMGPLKN